MACSTVTAYPQSVVPSPPLVSNSPGNAPQGGPLILKFLDSRTGAAVAPRELLVDGSRVDFQVEAGSLVVLSLSDGNHAIAVQAENYETIEFVASVSGAETPIMEVELDSTEAPGDVPVEEGKAILEGFVTDADTGALLSGVLLSLPDASMTTTTNETGKYEFVVGVPQKSEDSRPAMTLEVKAKDYQPLRMRNLALFSGNRRQLPLKLERLTSETQAADFIESDENAPDGPLRTYDWAFDVTLK